MLTPLFFAVAEAHDAAHAAEGGMVETFGLDAKYVVVQLISFLILFAVLYFKAIKPTIGAMTERQQKIDSGIEYAEEMKSKLEATQAESAALIKRAQFESQKIIDEARATAKQLADRETAAATERANGLITKAEQAITLEHKKMLDEARVEIARLVVATTQKVLATELSEADRSRYTEAAARELTTV